MPDDTPAAQADAPLHKRVRPMTSDERIALETADEERLAKLLRENDHANWSAAELAAKLLPYLSMFANSRLLDQLAAREAEAQQLASERDQYRDAADKGADELAGALIANRGLAERLLAGAEYLSTRGSRRSSSKRTSKPPRS